MWKLPSDDELIDMSTVARWRTIMRGGLEVILLRLKRAMGFKP